jgi:hypothetical protein
MEKQKQTIQEVISELKEILKVTLPHCDDDRPCGDDFISVNQKAYTCLKKLENLSV